MTLIMDTERCSRAVARRPQVSCLHAPPAAIAAVVVELALRDGDRLQPRCGRCAMLTATPTRVLGG